MHPILLVLCRRHDQSYAQKLSIVLAQDYLAVKVEQDYQANNILTVKLLAKRHRATHIACTCPKTFARITGRKLAGSPKDNYGTLVETQAGPVLLLPDLTSLYTQPHGTFVVRHFLTEKLQGNLIKKDKFSWDFCTPYNLQQWIETLSQATLIAVDIETHKENLRITSVAYTALLPDYKTKTVVVKLSPDSDIDFAFAAIAHFNSSAPPKVMQNGQYDATYFCRFNVPLHNWLYDTAYLQHCIFCELPKDLSYISSFYLSDYTYWKDESGTNLYEYNGKDTHNTLWTFIAQLAYIARHNCQYAFQNYALLFPVVFPALSCGLEGMKVIEPEMTALYNSRIEKKQEAADNLNFLLGTSNFNPGSSPQVKALFKAMGHEQPSSDKVSTQAFFEASSLNEPLVNYINQYRKAAKAASSYFSLTLLNGRCMYMLNPFGTKTGRMASKASNFWCGTQIQNVPGYAKGMFEAEEGWTFIAVDKSQSESYCTGYIAQEPGLIDAVNNSPDFHCQNASMFFGVPFEELYDALKKKVLRKDIRTLAKRVNHGANYNMMAGKLLQTMGTKAVILAKQLLKLPLHWSLKKVCEYLLHCFDLVYPRIRGEFQAEIKSEVMTTGKLYLACIGYTRRTFLKPHQNKLHLNECVAHKPQSLSVHLVNRAFVRLWRELQLGKYNGKYRLKAQVHDEILSIATDDVAEEVSKLQAEYMVIPVEIEGKVMSIPSTIAMGKLWSDCKD